MANILDELKAIDLSYLSKEEAKEFLKKSKEAIQDGVYAKSYLRNRQAIAAD